MPNYYGIITPMRAGIKHQYDLTEHPGEKKCPPLAFAIQGKLAPDHPAHLPMSEANNL